MKASDRLEQIEIAAQNNSVEALTWAHFIKGAQWADQNPSDWAFTEQKRVIEELASDLAIAGEALKEAVDRITGEYCSHSSPHGAHNDCWAKKQYEALEKIEGDK